MIVALMGMLLVGVVNPPTSEARTNNKNKPVLLVHGYRASWSSGASCHSFDDYKQFLKDQGFTRVYTIGFYSDHLDGCDYDATHHSHSNAGKCYEPAKYTNETGIQHVACAVAWTIYDHFTSRGETVDVVGHSMGGIVVRWGLGRVQRHRLDSSAATAYPPRVHVEDVVTMGSPHNGVRDIYSPCGTTQCNQMDPDSSFIDQLTTWKQMRNPQPTGRTKTDWTVMGSYGDDVVTQASATYDGMPYAQHKARWETKCHYHGARYECHSIGHSDFVRNTVTTKWYPVRWQREGESWRTSSSDFRPARWSVQSLKYGPGAMRG